MAVSLDVTHRIGIECRTPTCTYCSETSDAASGKVHHYLVTVTFEWMMMVGGASSLEIVTIATSEPQYAALSLSVRRLVKARSGFGMKVREIKDARSA